MEEQIKKIISELYEIDPALRDREAELIKIVQQLIIYRPDVKLDENFVNNLRSKLTEVRQPKTFSLNNFLNIFKFMTQKKYAWGGLVIVILILVPLVYFLGFNNHSPLKPGGNLDDWSFNSSAGSLQRKISQNLGAYQATGTGLSATDLGLAAGAPSMAAENIGFAVGGAKDINNFRQNIENKFLPLWTDITYEGLFYDYYFDTGRQAECQELFCPSYSYAITKDPISKTDDYYLAVGLNSGVKESDFQRKKLNLVVVLDISGSMGSPFNSYYYDQFGKQTALEGAETNDGRSKMEIADQSVVALLDHLKADDRFGMVVFDDQAYLAKPLNLVGETDMGAIKNHVLKIKPQGSTNLEAGLTMGTDLFKEFLSADQSQYENRIIVLTDAMPNTGNYGRNDFLNITKTNADNKLSSTFIGIGVDFNTDLIESITKIRGANYYSVHSAKEFKTRMDDEFDYMVTPLVFNLQLRLNAPGYQIEQVYGSPEANQSTGEIMKVNTLFPSKQTGGQTKGGLVLLKLKKVDENASLNLSVSYEDREGKVSQNQAAIHLEDKAPEYFQNNGIRKGVLLARYADLIKDWIHDERLNYTSPLPYKPTVDMQVGILPPEFAGPNLTEWERQSRPLKVSAEYKKFFSDFSLYFGGEMNAINDSSLQKEQDVLKNLISAN